MFRKNTASQFIHFQGVDSSTGGIKSGVTWTVRRCLDGTFAAATGTVTEDGTTGWYKFAMSQADTNGNNIGFNFTGTGAVPQTVNIVTTALDPTSTAFGLSIAKTTNITGFNDIAATAVVSSGAITTSGGAVSTVTSITNAVTVGTNNDKTGYGLSAAAVQAIWDALTTALTTVGSIGKLLVDNVNATISSRSTVTTAQVNTEVVDALNVDTYAEPGQGAPAATATLAAKINYLYKSWRNKKEQTSTTFSLYDDAGTTVDQKSTVSDDTVTATRGEVVSGP